MNYRHGFHAGNHADVLKHWALTLVLDRLLQKEKPIGVLDTHAGRGLYDLDSPAALRSAEFEGGVKKLLEDPDPPTIFHSYIESIRSQNLTGVLKWYPGSPAIIRDRLRRQDSLKLCELHPEERSALDASVGADRRVRTFEMDGYEAIRSFLPPLERRGLVLIDPPFEAPGEYERLAEAVADGVRRFATGVFMVWRPVKDEEGYAGFLRAVGALGLTSVLFAELRLMASAPRLTGSGLVIVNPTFGLAPALAEGMPYLLDRMKFGSGGSWTVREEEAGAIIFDKSGR